jgi:ring-1,2-phenylacetyl-CoA epoxidase subunit PaaD
MNTIKTIYDSTIRSGTEEIWEILKSVYDPEVPVLSILDLGIVRGIDFEASPPGGNSDKKVVVTITPTYSGCPAMDVITTSIRLAMAEHSYKNVLIKTVLSPAWTTDWMTETGKKKLEAYGIAPPANRVSTCSSMEADEQMTIQCPHCKSYHTQMISRFGSTACKALYKCLVCLEPFDYFKCH